MEFGNPYFLVVLFGIFHVIGGLMLGLMISPYLIQQAQTHENLELVDYVCGGLILVFFIFIGGSFAWTGFSAIRKRRTFDEHVAERELENEEKSQSKRRQ